MPKTRVAAATVTDALLRAYPYWRRHEGVRDNVCILATRTAIDVFKHFGVKATPMAVGVEILSAPLVAQIAEGRSPKDRSGLWDIEKCDPGARIVNVDPDKDTVPPQHCYEWWNGHLVARLDEDKPRLVDLSFEQFCRPEFRFPPLPRVFDLEAAEADEWKWILPGGDQVRFWATPANRGWIRITDWKPPVVTRKKIVRLINSVEAKLSVS